MKSTIKFIALSVVAAFLLIACSPSTENIKKEVVKSMNDVLNPKGITVQDLVLTKKSDQEFSGVLKTQEPNGNATYTVDIVFDGTNKSWKWKVN